MQSVTFGCIKSMLAEHIFKHLFAIYVDIPNTLILIVSKSKMNLESIAPQNSFSELSFHSGYIRRIKSPPCSDHLCCPILMTVVEASSEAPWIINSFVEFKGLRGAEATNGAQQRGLTRFILTNKARKIANLELAAVLHGPIVLDANFD